jgi:methylglyoxal synthase
MNHNRSQDLDLTLWFIQIYNISHDTDEIAIIHTLAVVYILELKTNKCTSAMLITSN